MQRTWVRVLTTAVTLTVMVMIFCFSMQQAERSDATSGWLANRIIALIRPDYESLTAEEQKTVYDGVQLVVRKCAHFTEFALLGFSLRLCLESWFGHPKEKDGEREKRRRGLTGSLSVSAWLGGTFYAALDELHQTLVDGRSGQVTDVMIDSAGVAVGMLLGVLLVKRISRALPREKKE